MSKKNIKNFLLGTAATTILTGAAFGVFYRVVADADRPYTNQGNLNWARYNANCAYDAFIAEMQSKRNEAYYILNAKPDTQINESESELESKVDSLFNEYLRYSPSVLEAEEFSNQAFKHLHKLEQDSIAAAKHDATPINENFKRNWKAMREHFSKQR